MSEVDSSPRETSFIEAQQPQTIAAVYHAPRRMAAFTGLALLAGAAIAPEPPSERLIPEVRQVLHHEASISAPVATYEPLKYTKDVIANSDYQQVYDRHLKIQSPDPDTWSYAKYHMPQITFNAHQEIAQRYGLQLANSVPMTEALRENLTKEHVTYAETWRVVQEYMSQIGVTIRLPDYANADEAGLITPNPELLESKMKDVVRSIGESFLAYTPKDFIDVITGGNGLEIILADIKGKDYAGLAYLGGKGNRIVIGSSAFGIIGHEIGHLIDGRVGRYKNDPAFEFLSKGYQFGGPKNPALTPAEYNKKKSALAGDLSRIYDASGYEACVLAERSLPDSLAPYASVVLFWSEYAMTDIGEDKAETSIDAFNFGTPLSDIPNLARKEEYIISQVTALSPAVGSYIANLKMPAKSQAEGNCQFWADPNRPSLK